MIVIVGHGPSIVGKRLGPWLDAQTVVRLKECPRPNAEDWGTRIDYSCGSSRRWEIPGVPFLLCPQKWLDYFHGFNPTYKPSTGLLALFCVYEMGHREIGLAGFDNILRPHIKGLTKWYNEPHKYAGCHDYESEHRAALGLGATLVDVTEDETWLSKVET